LRRFVRRALAISLNYLWLVPLAHWHRANGVAAHFPFRCNHQCILMRLPGFGVTGVANHAILNQQVLILAVVSLLPH
jgi:hypothetical protein